MIHSRDKVAIGLGLSWSERGFSVGCDELEQTATGWALFTRTAPCKKILCHLWEGRPCAEVSIWHALSVGRSVQRHTASWHTVGQCMEQKLPTSILTVVFPTQWYQLGDHCSADSD